MMTDILQQDEYHLYADHLKRLSSGDRYLRFNYPISDERIDAHAVQCAIEQRKILIVRDSTNTDMVVAAIEIAITNDTAEVGLTVEEAYRGKGLGSILFEQAINVARWHGLKKMYSYCLAHNRFMAAIARKKGMELNTEFGETIGEIKL